MEQIFSTLVEMAGPVALVALLATLYGNIKTLSSSEGLAQLVLGALFGAMSMLMMFSTKEPFEGLLIDLRNVPIALAGAFLGLRGMLVCLGIAALTRMGMGGVGATPGVAAMVIVGFAGLLWAEWRAQWPSTRWVHYLALCAMVETHQIALLLLPADLALWFLKTATVPLTVVNSLSIVLVAVLLDRETRLLGTREIIQAARDSALTRAFLTQFSLQDTIRDRQAAGTLPPVAGLLAVKLNYAPWIARVWGEQAIATVLIALRARLQTALTHSDLVALSEDGHILVPLTEEEISHGSFLEAKVVSAVVADRVTFNRDEWTRVTVSTSLTALDFGDPTAPLRYTRPKTQTNDFAQPPITPRPALPPWTGKSRVSGQLETALFHKADHLMQ